MLKNGIFGHKELHFRRSWSKVPVPSHSATNVVVYRTGFNIEATVTSITECLQFEENQQIVKKYYIFDRGRYFKQSSASKYTQVSREPLYPMCMM